MLTTFDHFSHFLDQKNFASLRAVAHCWEN